MFILMIDWGEDKQTCRMYSCIDRFLCCIIMIKGYAEDKQIK